MQTIEFPAAINLEKHCQNDFLDHLKLHRTFDTEVIVVPCGITMVLRVFTCDCHDNIIDNVKISS